MFDHLIANLPWCFVFGGCVVAAVVTTADLIRRADADWEPLTVKDGEIVEADR